MPHSMQNSITMIDSAQTGDEETWDKITKFRLLIIKITVAPTTPSVLHCFLITVVVLDRNGYAIRTPHKIK